MDKQKHVQTLLACDGDDSIDAYGAVVPPIYQNSLFTFDSWEAIETAFEDKINNPIYTRGCNPTVAMAERKIASLASAESARLFGSGMAAIAAGMLHFLSAGDHVIAVKNIYGPAINLLKKFIMPKMAVEVTFVDGKDITDFSKHIKPNTKLIYLESPSSLVFELQDIAAVATLAKQHDIATMIDNTWATPLFQKPLALGIDLEMHSCSKYLGGHSDIVSGVLIGKESLIHAIHSCEYELLGAKMAPMEAWLLLRSLRTLDMRMARHQQSAELIAEFLSNHAKVAKVFHPQVDDYPQKQLANQQMTGFSGLLSFELNTQDKYQIKQFVNALKIFKIGVSWGGHESLVNAPAISLTKEQTPEQIKQMGISIANIRISVGLENVDDLLQDLTQALNILQ